MYPSSSLPEWVGNHQHMIVQMIEIKFPSEIQPTLYVSPGKPAIAEPSPRQVWNLPEPSRNQSMLQFIWNFLQNLKEKTCHVSWSPLKSWWLTLSSLRFPLKVLVALGGAFRSTCLGHIGAELGQCQWGKPRSTRQPWDRIDRGLTHQIYSRGRIAKNHWE